MTADVVIPFELGVDLAQRINALAARTGRSSDSIIGELVERGLDRFEYEYDLVARADAVRRGDVPTKSLEQIGIELGLTD